MTISQRARRTAVTLGVVLALALAAVTIQVAASWAAENAQLDSPPVSVESVQQALARERERSEALETQIGTLEAASRELAASLAGAEAQLGTDQATAEELRTSLAAAQARLAKLEAALEAARTTTALRSSTTSSGGSITTVSEHEDDHELGDD